MEPTESAASSDRTSQETPFFAVSIVKLLVMSTCTLSLYEVYWFYRNWRIIKFRERANLWPAPRALFAIFFCYACFARVRDYGDATRSAPRLPAGLLAAGWIITSLLWKLPDPFWWASMFAVVFLIPVQQHVNRINAATAPTHVRNDRLSGWNWVVVVIGGLLLLLALVGTFLQQTDGPRARTHGVVASSRAGDPVTPRPSVPATDGCDGLADFTIV